QRVCSDCTKTETRDVAATGHSFGNWKQTVAPKCEEKGKEQRVCSDCTKTETRGVAATGHKPGEWIIDKDADVYEDGSKHSTCTECQKEYKEVIPRLAPGEVTLKSVSNSSGYVLVKWEATEGADSYIIYRKKNTATVWTKYATSETTSYKDTSVNSGSKYTDKIGYICKRQNRSFG
ncbi:MAG: fibronectin type III domain-containing protein, partial [Clostridia bacterium]|nr:fibronectin type III domain-containing protein [Clostridia bacterium]